MNCPNCGREVKPTDKFCIACGARLENSEGENGRFNTKAMKNLAGKTINHAADSLMGMSKNGIDLMVRRFFFGYADVMLISVLVDIIALFLIVFFGIDYYTFSIKGFGVFCEIIQVLAVIAFVMSIKKSIQIKSGGEAKFRVDQATNKSISQLKSRAIEKFNVDEEQLEEVEPVVIAGAGVTPSMRFSENATKTKKIAGIFERLYSKDPFEVCRVDSKAVPRYLLIQTTVYAFTDTQLLVYVGNIDISTGVVYDETVSEVFYSDVNSLVQQEILKKHNKKYYTLKYLVLDVCGISKTAAFDSRLVHNVDERLAGMETYIREKKN